MKDMLEAIEEYRIKFLPVFDGEGIVKTIHSVYN